MPDGVPVLYSDDALFVIDKPAGLLSVPGRGEHLQDCAATRVQASFVDARVVHRLDQATSGLMLFARGAAAQRTLSRAFEARLVGKRYVAVVSGLVNDDEGCIDLPLACDWPNRPRQQVDRMNGKASQTRWWVLSRDAANGSTRLELEPLTGRSHQLRVHLLAICHPIIGDALYAPPERQAARLMLHASALTIAHPGDARPMNFVSAAPF
jgi:tRNA pseudouridine32 synthase / 23S rRNA pseudouridine746 synthase